MKAIVQDAHGPPEVLRLEDVDTPVIEAGEVLVRVHAAGLDPGVWHLVTGLPYLLWIMGYGLRRPKVRVLGTDVAGRIEAVGNGVTRFRPSDEGSDELGRGRSAEAGHVGPESLGDLRGEGPHASGGPPLVSFISSSSGQTHGQGRQCLERRQ